MNAVMQARGRLGGRPRRQSFDEIQLSRGQSLEIVKIKKIKRTGGIKAKNGGNSEFNLLKRLVNLEFREVSNV